MENLNFVSVASYALKNHCSFIGGRPASDILNGFNGEIIFMFKKDHFGNLFFQWIRCTFDSSQYQEKLLVYKGKEYFALFLLIPQKIPSKFLYSFKTFSKSCAYLLGYFFK
ncbi:MAG: hypothetical protein AB1432_15685 [Bacteroidota bacterium]